MKSYKLFNLFFIYIMNVVIDLNNLNKLLLLKLLYLMEGTKWSIYAFVFISWKIFVNINLFDFFVYTFIELYFL